MLDILGRSRDSQHALDIFFTEMSQNFDILKKKQRLPVYTFYFPHTVYNIKKYLGGSRYCQHALDIFP
jgi:hypothetical protein